MSDTGSTSETQVICFKTTTPDVTVHSLFDTAGWQVRRGLSLVPGCLFDDVLEEDEPSVQSALDLLQEMEDLLVV